MTTFDGTTNADTATKENKPEPSTVLLPSRVKDDPKLWAEALEFADMLTYCRPDQSRTERKFIAKYIFPLGGVFFDKKGNAYKQVGDNPTVLWSCHTDTVHRAKGFQKIVYWPHKNSGDIFFEVDNKKVRSSCLGADDTCGVWLMIQMIKANVPGLYIFHRGEEVGGQGSKWISEKNKTALEGIKFAIAFDRKGEKSVITYQRSKRCCSDEFAKSLAEQLGMGHECDTGGSFTDTASYVDLIPECTNISAGYQDAHCAYESTNVDYLFRLRDALLKLDVTKLVEKRKAGENTPLYQSYSYNGHNHWSDHWGHDGFYGMYGSGNTTETKKREGGLTGLELRNKYKGNNSWFHDYDFDQGAGLWFPIRKKDLGVVKVYNGNKKTPLAKTVADKWPGRAPSYTDMVRMIKENPEVIADLLEMDGYGPVQILDHLLVTSESGNTIHL